MRSLRCWLGLHHFDVLQTEHHEMYLRCSEPGCLARSKGWDLHQVDNRDRAQLRTMLRDERKVAA